MTLNSKMHEIYLSMPMEATLMPELQNLPYWARMTHEILMEVNPAKLSELANSNQLESYLKQQQARLSEEARKLEKQWRSQNPLGQEANYFQRTSWLNHCKQYAREVLIGDLTKSLAALANES
uniref:TnpV protein n=1 Tax=Stutzerimonas frequens TaxID=2968969 RepID=UPI00398AE6D1